MSSPQRRHDAKDLLQKNIFVASSRLRGEIARSLPNTEPREDVPQQIFRRALAGHFFQRGARVLKIGQHEFFRHRTARCLHASAARRSAARARSSRAAWRTLVTAAVSRAVAGLAPSSAARISTRSASRPSPVFDETRHDRRSDVGRAPRRRQIGFVRHDETRRTRVSRAADRSRRRRAGATCRAPPAPGPRSSRRGARERLLRLSTSSVVSRTPAVSTSSSLRPSISAVSVTRSRVVPGIGVTIARPARSSALNRLDLPTFGFPTIATRAPSRISRPRLRLAQQRRDFPFNRSQCRTRLAGLDEVVALVWKIERRFELARSDRTARHRSRRCARSACLPAGRTPRAPAAA